MKKNLVAFLTILALFFATLPLSSVQAKEAKEVDLKVRNRTGFTVSLTLYDQEGHPSSFTLEPGQTLITIPEGKFTYYAVTKCGVKTGVFNLNVTKELFLACGEGPQVSLFRPEVTPACTVYAYWHVYNDEPDGGHWHGFVGSQVPFDLDISSWEPRCADGADIKSD